MQKLFKNTQRSGSPLEVLLAFGKLGVGCLGEPIAHILPRDFVSHAFRTSGPEHDV